MEEELSERERDILCLLAQCHTYNEIGKELGLSLKTVYNNICTLMPKIGVHRKELLIKYAQQNGFGSARKAASV
jgi:DNA-binding NarL/FixJ family response regulator